MGLKWQMCDKYMSCIYVTLYRVNAGKFVFLCENLKFGASLHHLSECIDDDMMCIICLFSYGSPVVIRCMGFGWVWVGLGHGSISSPGSGLGWVGSVCPWVGLGRGL